MSLYLVTDNEHRSFKKLVELNEAQVKHIEEGGYTVEAIEPITFGDFIVGHSPLTDLTGS